MSLREAAPGMGAREWVLLLVLALLWAGSFFFYKVLVAEIPPLTIVLGRVGLAALVLHAVLLARRDPMTHDLKMWRSFAVMGLLNNVIPFTLIVWGEMRISSGLASILNATTPIFTVLAAHVLTQNEKLSWNKAVGVIFGFLGVVALIGPTALHHGAVGDVASETGCLLAALSYAFAGIYGRRFKGVPLLKVATGQITASTVILIPLVLGVDRPWRLPLPSASAFAAWGGIALFSTALAYLIYFRIIRTAGATNVALVTLLLPIGALLLGATFLDETITMTALGGMALIGIGLAAIDGRALALVRRRLTSPAPATPSPAIAVRLRRSGQRNG
ncbi:MAG: DMT family transporter [Azospirillaceae bacterium]|nr:DMT family transporter [Azospirillaceae bacterium]